MSAILLKAQAAIAEFIKDGQTQTDCDKYNVYAGLNDEIQSLPRIVVTATDAEELAVNMNIYYVRVMVSLTTKMKANTTAEHELHTDAVVALGDILLASYEDQLAFCNKPSSGADTRPVKDFTLSGWYVTESPQMEINGSNVTSTAVLRVTCSMGDLP